MSCVALDLSYLVLQPAELIISPRGILISATLSSSLLNFGFIVLYR